jgi:hypothetical protein
MFTFRGLDLAIVFLCYNGQILPETLFKVVMTMAFLGILTAFITENRKKERKKLEDEHLKLKIKDVEKENANRRRERRLRL